MSHYYQASEAQDALAVVAKWMSNNPNLTVNYHEGTAVDADVFNGVIRIPKLSLASGLTNETLTLLRGQVYHESGHIFDADILNKIKKDGRYPSGVLFSIWNAVEDMRMERAVGLRFLGAKPIFNWNSNYHNEKIAERVAQGQELGAVWEALVAMMFQSDSKPAKWRLSEKAQMYFNAAYDTFIKWKSTTNSFETLDLAEELFEIFKEVKKLEDFMDRNNDDEEQEQEQDDQEQDGGQGEGDNDESDTDESDEDENGQSGQGEESDEDDDSEEQGVSQASGEESDDSDESEEGESQNGSDGSDSEDGEETEGEANTAEAGEADADSDADEVDDIVAQLEKELDGISLKELQDEDIEKAFEALDAENSEYLADKSSDIHKTIEPRREDNEEYMETRKKVSATVASMSAALQQALLARAESTVMTHQYRGKLDTDRLTHMMKGLGKNIFYEIEEGEDINTAIEIIIDESYSMSYNGLVYPVRQVALAIAEVLTQLDIPFEITGTTTNSYGDWEYSDMIDRTKPMVYKHYKTFNQNWNVVKTAIMQTDAIDNNVDGEAVEYAASRLQARPEQRKIVLSLSDGEPYNGQTETRKLERHLVRTCEQCRKNGVEVYGFGIKTRDPERFYGKDYFIYLDDIDTDFTKAVVEIITGGRFS
jgi:hypothetical protein